MAAAVAAESADTCANCITLYKRAPSIARLIPPTSTRPNARTRTSVAWPFSFFDFAMQCSSEGDDALADAPEIHAKRQDRERIVGVDGLHGDFRTGTVATGVTVAIGVGHIHRKAGWI